MKDAGAGVPMITVPETVPEGWIVDSGTGVVGSSPVGVYRIVVVTNRAA